MLQRHVVQHDFKHAAFTSPKNIPTCGVELTHGVKVMLKCCRPSLLCSWSAVLVRLVVSIPASCSTRLAVWLTSTGSDLPALQSSLLMLSSKLSSTALLLTLLSSKLNLTALLLTLTKSATMHLIHQCSLQGHVEKASSCMSLREELKTCFPLGIKI